MNLLDSLLDAIVRLEGDALVMHVGEKPYVVTTTSAMSEFRGPLLWGHVDLSSRVLTSEAVLGVLGQILPFDQRQTLEELGAIEHVIDAPERPARFSIIAARAGDEVWVEVRRRPKDVAVAVAQPVVDDQVSAAAPAVETHEAEVQQAPIAPPPESATAESIDEPIEEPIEKPIEEPLYHADTIESIEQFAPTEVPLAAARESEPVASLAEAALAAGVEHSETGDAPFEIVHEVTQDAPTDADVDALLGESADALLRTAAPAFTREPLDFPAGAWHEIEEQVPAETIPPVVAKPMRLASETESIVIASELQRAASAPELQPVPLIAEVEARADATASLLAQPTVVESKPMVAGPEVQSECVEPVEEFAHDDELPVPCTPLEPVRTEAIDRLAQAVATAPQFELALVGETRSFEPVADAEDFHLVAPIASASADALPFELDHESDSHPLGADVQPELLAFAQDAVVALPPTGEIEEVAPAYVAMALEPEAVGVAAASANERFAFVAAAVGVPALVHASPVSTAHPSNRMSTLPPEGTRHVNHVMGPESTHEPHAQAECPAVVVPMAQRPSTGTSRVDAGTNVAGVPASPNSETAAVPTDLAADFSLDALLRLAAARGASTVYLVARSRPMVRAEGDISALDIAGAAPLEERDIARLLQSAPESARDAWQGGASAEWICDVAGVGRVRGMTFRDHRGPGAIFRMFPPQAISADQLGLTPEVQALCTETDGLVLVTGPRLTAKSTLMSGFVDLINRTRSDHVITIESQVEFVHESRRSFISQREVSADGEAIVTAVRSALREDPDVLFIGELTSPEVAAVALEAAESGRLVFASLSAPTTTAAVGRMLELLPADRPHARALLASSLRGVVAEVLVGRMRGGRVAAREVLLNTAAVADLILEAKTDQLPPAIENGRRHGMMPLNDVLAAFVREGTVHVSEAYRKAFDKESLLAALRQEGVDTSFAEKIA